MPAMTTALRPEERSATIPPAAAAAAALHGALLESRQRWQDLAGLAADFVFETDNAGRFSFLWPEHVLGHRGGRPAGPAGGLPAAGHRDRPLRPAPGACAITGSGWPARAGGRAALPSSLAPIGDARGQFAGLRGAAHDVTDQEAAATAAAAGLRRAALLDALGETVRHAGTAHEALANGLAELRDALGCAGTAMVVPGRDRRRDHRRHHPRCRPALRDCAGEALGRGAGLARRISMTAGRPRCSTIMAARRPSRPWPPGARPARATGTPRTSRCCAAWRPRSVPCSASAGCRRNWNGRPAPTR